MYEKVRMAIMESGLTFRQVAQYLGISPQGLSNKIRRNTLSAEELRKVAYLTGGFYQEAFFITPLEWDETFTEKERRK